MLVVYLRKSVADLNKWVSDSQGAAGLPDEWRPKGSVCPAIYEPLASAFGSQWQEPMLEAVGGAMARWEGAGQQVGLVPQRIKDYRKLMPAALKKGGAPRWKTPQVLFNVADLIRDSREQIEQLLKVGEAPPQPTFMEALVMQKAMEVDLRGAEAEARRKTEAHRKSAISRRGG